MNNDVNQKIRAKKGHALVYELHELEIYPKWEGNSECYVCVFRSEGIPGAVRTESRLQHQLCSKQASGKGIHTALKILLTPSLDEIISHQVMGAHREVCVPSPASPSHGEC